MSDRKSPKRLIININPELHYELKKRALERGQTLRKWLWVAIQERIAKEKQYE